MTFVRDTRLMKWRVVAATVLVLAQGLTGWSDEPISFNRDVRPILSNHCYQCHGPDEKHREGGLRLDGRDAAMAKLESGETALVPGDAAASHLIARITSADAGLVMPPPEIGKPLSPAQIETLTKWIAQGAEYQGHWSFLPPADAAPPDIARPEFVQNPIDRFVLKRLLAEGLEPSPEADRMTLLRRVTLDLTGLPPTPAEVDAFLNDASPNAYEKVVDRLLQSPRYGEHMARYWLDAARYGDTHGLHLDNERSLWPYRDWVIDAFNSNKPFDQFTVEQIAGDLLPEASRDQKIASGFNRCNVTTSEGGSINDEVLVRYAVDRTEAIGTIFMGLTLNCSVCHTHKFDPITQSEFYGLYAFFNSLADAAMDGNALLPPPYIKLPTSEQEAAMSDLDQKIAATNAEIASAVAKAASEYQDPADADVPADALGVLRQEYVWIDDAPPAGAQLQPNAGEWRFVSEPVKPFSGQNSHVRSAAGLTQHFFTGATPPLPIGAGDSFFTYVYLDPANPPKTIMLQFNDGSWEHRAYWGENAIAWGADDSPSRRRMGDLPPAGQWTKLEVPVESVGLTSGSVVNGWAFTQFDGTVYWDKSGLKTRELGGGYDSLKEWIEFAAKADAKVVPQDIINIAKVEPDKRNDDQKNRLRDHFLRNVHADLRGVFDPLNQRLDSLNQQKTQLDNQIPATMVSEDLAQPREAFVLVRGAYDKQGDKVERGVPKVFPPLPEGAPVNRLGLARWLTMPGHPLTARVTVNRYWQQFFGTGIVKTAEDFGSQGEWPSHPDLLDWLATEFIRSGWNVKEMHKLIVMSGTYRQSSKVNPELLAKDPENRLLARGPRFRLDAESIRDSLLFISGLLVERDGGKSVKPPQPEGVWEAVAFVGSNTRQFSADSGPAIYRRSLYTFWKRTSPPPMMLAFDAPSRESCTVRRARTNTPLQALALMNERQSIDAARKFAERITTEGGDQPASRIDQAFRLALGRSATSREQDVLQRVLASQKEIFTADPKAAEELANYGDAPRPGTMEVADFAAWTMVANLILNLDELVTKE
jgi:hypothetical protein